MRAGNLNKYVTIQYPTKASDSIGGMTTSWSDLGSVWAAVWPVSSKEYSLHQQETMEVTHRIRIRYRNEVRASYRIKFGNKYYQIKSIVNPGTENRWLDLLCKEVV
jgi:SPP1 family predicted phage head-tail adaptor